MDLDKKCENFKEYLHSSGAINALKEALAAVYRLEDWPADPIAMICPILSCGQNETVASSTGEIDNSGEELHNSYPNEESKEEDKRVEFEENVGENRELEVMLSRPPSSAFVEEFEEGNQDDDMIQIVDELTDPTHKEDLLDHGQQISTQEVDNQSKLDGPDSPSTEQDMKSSEVLPKKANRKRKQRKNHN